MKYVLSFLLFLVVQTCFSQSIDFRGRAMVMLDSLHENQIIEVSDTLMRKVEVVRNNNGAHKVQGFMFGYNDDGLFQNIRVSGEKIPLDHLKKALDTKTPKIYFNKMEVKHGFRTVEISFILRIIYH